MHKRVFALFFLVVILLSISGCSLFRHVTGTYVDTDRIAADRNAAVAQARHTYAQQLADRLRTGKPLDDADIIVSIHEDLFNVIGKEFKGTSGWLNPETQFTIQQLSFVINNGSAIASVQLGVKSLTYNVDVDLVMDCLVAVHADSGDLVATLEPFNIVPAVTARGMLSAVESIIKDLLAEKLSTLGKQLPPIRLPINVESNLVIQETFIPLRGMVNMNIESPRRHVSYSLVMKDVLFLQKILYIAVDLKKVSVR